eukprot:scaffold147270_cov21-Tisochrysis_lutea.AAC.1
MGEMWQAMAFHAGCHPRSMQMGLTCSWRVGGLCLVVKNVKVDTNVSMKSCSLTPPSSMRVGVVWQVTGCYEQISIDSDAMPEDALLKFKKLKGNRAHVWPIPWMKPWSCAMSPGLQDLCICIPRNAHNNMGLGSLTCWSVDPLEDASFVRVAGSERGAAALTAARDRAASQDGFAPGTSSLHASPQLSATTTTAAAAAAAVAEGRVREPLCIWLRAKRLRNDASHPVCVCVQCVCWARELRALHCLMIARVCKWLRTTCVRFKSMHAHLPAPKIIGQGSGIAWGSYTMQGSNHSIPSRSTRVTRVTREKGLSLQIFKEHCTQCEAREVWGGEMKRCWCCNAARREDQKARASTRMPGMMSA